MVDAVPNPAEFGGVEFINGGFFMSFDGNQAVLRDDKGKMVASCSVPGRGGRFATKIVDTNVAFAFTNDKNKPAIGIVRIPAPGAMAPPPVVAVKGQSAFDLLGEKSPPPEAAKQRTFDQQEIWEFGWQGIVRSGILSVER
jgi:hypothetical protein